MIRRTLLYSLLVSLLTVATGFAQSPSGPEVGSVIDEFGLNDQHGTSHQLTSLLKDGPVALVVFRSADW